MKERKPIHVPGMKPWACEYTGADGLRYGIILYGSDPDQIEADHCERLWGLIVVGELLSIVEDT